MMHVDLLRTSVVISGLWSGIAGSLLAQELPLPMAQLERSEPVDFAKEILPILKQNCLACHHEKEAEGGLVLESIDRILAGGDSGQAVVPKDLAASLLFARSTGAEEPLMPPEDNSVGAKPLTPEQLGLLQRWIEEGAAGSEMTDSEPIDWQPIPPSIRTVYAMDVSPDGRFAVVGRGNRVALIDLATRAEETFLVDPSLNVGPVADVDLVQSIAVAPDAERIATGGFRTVRLWKQVTAAVDAAAARLANSAGLIAVKGDQSAAAWVNAIGDIEVWNLAGAEPLQTLAGHAQPISGLAWAGDSDRILSCDPSGRLIAWQASSGAKTAQFEANSALLSLSAAADGMHAAALDAAGKVQLFRIADDGSSIARISEAAGGIADATAAIIADKPAPMVIVASQAGGVMMLGLADQQVIRKLDPGAAVDALGLTADGSRLVTGGRDGKARLWNLADGQPGVTMESDPQSQLQLATASRDALRQQASVARLNQKTTELDSLLAKENEVLGKVSEEHKKAAEALAAEEKKRLDAVAVVAGTEGKIAKATSDAAKAAEMIQAATQLLAAAQAASVQATKDIETQQGELAAAEEAAKKAQQQLDEITKAKNEADARVKQINQLIADKQAALNKAKQEASEAQVQIDTGNKMAAEAKATADQATKELEAQKKAVTAADEAKQKSEAEVVKRQQALDAATSAQQRAAAAVPAHQADIQAATRHQGLLDQQLTSTQARLAGAGNEIIAVSVSRDDASIATAQRDGSVRLYRASDGRPLRRFQSAPPTDRSQLVFVADTLCQFGPASTPSAWSRRADWVLERTIGSIGDPAILSDRVTAMDFRPDGKTIAVGSGPASRSGEVKVFAVDSGQLVRDFGEVHSDTVLGLQFSPTGDTIASSAADKTIRLLDVASAQVIRSLEGHTHHVLGIAWQDDGQTIASASADKTVKIWNTETGEQRRTISGFSKEITAVAFVQTSNQIVTACADGQLRLSDTSNGNAIRNFNASGDFLFALAVTPDGKELLAGGQSGSIRFWTLADANLVHELK
jgi:WD40 repeat protein